MRVGAVGQVGHDDVDDQQPGAGAVNRLLECQNIGQCRRAKCAVSVDGHTVDRVHLGDVGARSVEAGPHGVGQAVFY